MGWNTRTNLRSVETITQLVVEICNQMEDWRRLLRHLERSESDREVANLSLFRPPGRDAA